MLKQRRMIVTAVLLISLLAAGMVPVHANAPIELQGEIVGGRFLVPMRSIFEGLGAAVEWDGTTRTVTGIRGDTTVSLVIDNRNAVVNGEGIQLDVPAQLVANRTYVPASFVARALGADVSWDPDTRSATITMGEKVIVVYQDRPPVVALPPPGEQRRVVYSVTPAFVPEGGGQTLTLAVTVVDEEGQPMEGMHVSFFAESREEGERHGQLSAQHVETDESGRVSVTYTTLARDDQQQVSIRMTTSVVEDEWVEKDHHFVASSTASRVEGTVRNPFTGAPSPGTSINFGNESTGRRYYVEVDDWGRYSLQLPAGTYNLDIFNIDTRGASPAITQSYEGSHHRMNAMGIEWAAIPAEVTQAGSTMTLDYNNGILRGTISGRSSGEMAIIPEGSGGLIQDRTVLAKIAPDGSFVIPLPPGNYSLFMGGANPFMRNVSVAGGQSNDLGTVSVN